MQPDAYLPTAGVKIPAEAFQRLGLPADDLTASALHTHLRDDRRDDAAGLTGPQILEHISELFASYPWLAVVAHVAGGSDAPSMRMQRSVGNHIFDDYPAAFGITQIEGHVLRAFMENETDEFMRIAGALLDNVLPSPAGS